MSARDNKKSETTTPASAAAGAATDDKPSKATKGGKDGDRPQTTRGRGGQRGGYGRGRGDRRPQTAKDVDAADNDDTKGAQKGGRGRGAQRANQGKTQDPDSWINKFHNLQRPKRDEGEFTADTKIPERPSKEQILKEPSKSVFESDMANIDKAIDQKRKEIQSIIKKKKSIREGGFTTGNNTKRDELNQRNNEMKAVRDVKNDLGRKLKDLHAQIDALEGEKAQLLKTLHPKHHTVDQVKQGIKDLEYEMTTRTLNAA